MMKETEVARKAADKTKEAGGTTKSGKHTDAREIGVDKVRKPIAQSMNDSKERVAAQVEKSASTPVKHDIIERLNTVRFLIPCGTSSGVCTHTQWRRLDHLRARQVACGRAVGHKGGLKFSATSHGQRKAGLDCVFWYCWTFPFLAFLEPRTLDVWLYSLQIFCHVEPPGAHGDYPSVRTLLLRKRPRFGESLEEARNASAFCAAFPLHQGIILPDSSRMYCED